MTPHRCSGMSAGGSSVLSGGYCQLTRVLLADGMRADQLLHNHFAKVCMPS
jgi:hypothetical protein